MLLNIKTRGRLWKLKKPILQKEKQVITKNIQWFTEILFYCQQELRVFLAEKKKLLFYDSACPWGHSRQWMLCAGAHSNANLNMKQCFPKHKKVIHCMLMQHGIEAISWLSFSAVNEATIKTLILCLGKASLLISQEQ